MYFGFSLFRYTKIFLFRHKAHFKELNGLFFIYSVTSASHIIPTRISFKNSRATHSKIHKKNKTNTFT